jgi:hypothetical protein
MNCTGTNNFCTWVASFVVLINPLIALASALAVAIFFWGLVQYVYAAGNSKTHAKGKDLILWGLLALFVLFSLWGIINFFINDLLPGNSGGVQHTGGGTTQIQA